MKIRCKCLVGEPDNVGEDGTGSIRIYFKIKLEGVEWLNLAQDMED